MKIGFESIKLSSIRTITWSNYHIMSGDSFVFDLAQIPSGSMSI
jgi:hypothetical protein